MSLIDSRNWLSLHFFFFFLQFAPPRLYRRVLDAIDWRAMHLCRLQRDRVMVST